VHLSKGKQITCAVNGACAYLRIRGSPEEKKRRCKQWYFFPTELITNAVDIGRCEFDSARPRTFGEIKNLAVAPSLASCPERPDSKIRSAARFFIIEIEEIEIQRSRVRSSGTSIFFKRHLQKPFRNVPEIGGRKWSWRWACRDPLFLQKKQTKKITLTSTGRFSVGPSLQLIERPFQSSFAYVCHSWRPSDQSRTRGLKLPLL
jgi:hypothetical protein